MLLGTESQLRALEADFGAFVSSSAAGISFSAATDGSAEPYPEFLNGLRVRKHDGESRLTLTADRWLELSASIEELHRFQQLLLVSESNGHTHWYCKPVSLIIEADNDWPGHES